MTDAFTEQLKSDNKRLLDSNDALQKENKRLLSSNAQIGDSINSSKLEVESILSTKTKLEAEIQGLAVRQNEVFSLLSSVDSELANKNLELEELLKKISAAENKYFELIKASNDKLNVLKKEHGDFMALKADEVASKKKELDRLVERLEELKTSIKVCETDLETAQIKNKNVIFELEAEIHSKSLKIKAIDRENAAIEENIANNKKIFNDIKELKNLSITLDKSKSELESLIEDLNKEIPALESRKKEIEDEIEVLKENKISCDIEYETAKKKIFAIADREREVSEKEEFVKSKFEEANLTY